MSKRRPRPRLTLLDVIGLLILLILGATVVMVYSDVLSAQSPVQVVRLPEVVPQTGR